MNDKIMVKRDIVIIGGGPAGLAAALAAKKEGAESILILERDKELGGILNQCIHNGFGLHTFQEELTGPEYAARFIRMVKEQQIEYRLNTMVMDISQDKVITAMSRQEGMYQIRAKAVILAMGCRERPRGALNIPGYRPAGIYSAGTAQRLVNMEGFMPGKKVVILGSGDIGLIMARRMTLEGAEVIQYFQRKAFLLRPSAVHTIKHSAPVASFCTAGSCVQLDDGILSVVLSGKKCLHTDAVKACLELVQHFLDLRDDLRIILLISHLDHGFHIFHLCFQIMVCLNIILETL